MNRIEETLLALRTKPLKSTTYERVLILRDLQSVYENLPQPLRLGHVLCDFLERVSTPVEPHDLIVGRHLDHPLNAEEEAVFQSFLKDPKNLYRTTIYDTGHCTLDWAWLIKFGLPGLRDHAQNSISTAKDEAHAIFLQGAVLVYEAFIKFARRYAAAARQAGLVEAAGSLDALCVHAPHTFREGLQLVWLVNLVDGSYLTLNPTLSQGRLDVLLNPLYQADLAAGCLTPDQALELITDFYCKHNLNMGRGEHQQGTIENTTTFQRILNFDAPQYLPLAGTDAHGNSAVNPLTTLFVKALVPGFKNPIPVVRFHKNMDTEYPELWDVLMEKSLQSCSMMFYHDGDVQTALVKAGIPPQDAVNYDHFGCNWCTPGPDSCWMAIMPRSIAFLPENQAARDLQRTMIPYYVNSQAGWCHDFLLVMHELDARPIPPKSIDDFYDAFFARLRDFLTRRLDYMIKELKFRQSRPSAVLTLGDCLTREAIARAESKAATAKYHFDLQSFWGIASLIDCFTAIDQLVFREHSTTLHELTAAVDANFQGCERLLALCRHAEKFGSDMPLSNSHAERLTHESADIIKEMCAPALRDYGFFFMPSLEGDTGHLTYGRLCGATPDGRLAGEVLSQNTRPANGSCKKGLTAMFASLLHLSFDRHTSGALNLDVQPEQFAGKAGRALFGKLLGSYFNHGGLHAQVSCVSVDDLKNAQVHPEQYRDLLVRVTGYSGIFVDMGAAIQQDVINRMIS